jgi:dTDP-4-dehydrorhamnose reductase
MSWASPLLTSERFLDDRWSATRRTRTAATGGTSYADVEAVRVVAEGLAGRRLLREAWERYRLPLAVTEVHLGCTRERQTALARGGVGRARAASAQDGADVRAVTVWSLLRAYDWDSLLTCARGSYEPGVFDLRFLPRVRRTGTPASTARPA